MKHCPLGLPRLPGGEEGGQAAFVRSIGNKLAQKARKFLILMSGIRPQETANTMAMLLLPARFSMYIYRELEI